MTVKQKINVLSFIFKGKEKKRIERKKKEKIKENVVFFYVSEKNTCRLLQLVCSTIYVQKRLRGTFVDD
jgi:hypothetical protein